MSAPYDPYARDPREEPHNPSSLRGAATTNGLSIRLRQNTALGPVNPPRHRSRCPPSARPAHRSAHGPPTITSPHNSGEMITRLPRAEAVNHGASRTS